MGANKTSPHLRAPRGVSADPSAVLRGDGEGRGAGTVPRLQLL